MFLYAFGVQELFCKFFAKLMGRMFFGFVPFLKLKILEFYKQLFHREDRMRLHYLHTWESLAQMFCVD